MSKALLIVLLALGLACIGGVVWAKAIYVPRAAPPVTSLFLLLEATPGGFWLDEGGTKLTCELNGC